MEDGPIINGIDFSLIEDFTSIYPFISEDEVPRALQICEVRLVERLLRALGALLGPYLT